MGVVDGAALRRQRARHHLLLGHDPAAIILPLTVTVTLPLTLTPTLTLTLTLTLALSTRWSTARRGRRSCASYVTS